MLNIIIFGFRFLKDEILRLRGLFDNERESQLRLAQESEANSRKYENQIGELQDLLRQSEEISCDLQSNLQSEGQQTIEVLSQINSLKVQAEARERRFDELRAYYDQDIARLQEALESERQIRKKAFEDQTKVADALTKLMSSVELMRASEHHRRNMDESLRLELNESNRFLAQVCSQEDILKSKRMEHVERIAALIHDHAPPGHPLCNMPAGPSLANDRYHNPFHHDYDPYQHAASSLGRGGEYMQGDGMGYFMMQAGAQYAHSQNDILDDYCEETANQYQDQKKILNPRYEFVYMKCCTCMSNMPVQYISHSREFLQPEP